LRGLFWFTDAVILLKHVDPSRLAAIPVFILYGSNTMVEDLNIVLERQIVSMRTKLCGLTRWEQIAEELIKRYNVQFRSLELNFSGTRVNAILPSFVWYVP
jgi:hypothetical protein